jgi:hypothetical protein
MVNGHRSSVIGQPLPYKNKPKFADSKLADIPSRSFRWSMERATQTENERNFLSINILKSGRYRPQSLTFAVVLLCVLSRSPWPGSCALLRVIFPVAYLAVLCESYPVRLHHEAAHNLILKKR